MLKLSFVNDKHTVVHNLIPSHVTSHIPAHPAFVVESENVYSIAIKKMDW